MGWLVLIGAGLVFLAYLGMKNSTRNLRADTAATRQRMAEAEEEHRRIMKILNPTAQPTSVKPDSKA